MPIFRVKSVKIYTSQKKFTRVYPWLPWQIWGMTKWLNCFTPARQWPMWVQRNHNHYCSDHRQQFTFLRWVFIWNNPKWLPVPIPTPSRPNSWCWRRRDQYSLSEARSPSRSYLPRTWIAQRTQCIHWLLEPAYDPSTSTSTSPPTISFPTLRLTRLNCPAALNEDPQSQTKATESAKHSCCWHYFYLMWSFNANTLFPSFFKDLWRLFVARC